MTSTEAALRAPQSEQNAPGASRSEAPAPSRQGTPATWRQAPKDPGARFSHIDGLRAVAALWVTLYHALLGLLPQWEHNPLAYVVTAGDLGVPMFLVLSGFCLAYPLLSKERDRVPLRSFAIRRALRILPPYYLVMFTLAAAQQLPFVARRTAQEVTDLPDFMTHVFMVHNWWPDHILRISGPFWSIALEVQFYVVFPLLFVFMKRPWALLAGTMGMAAAWCLAAPVLLGSIPAATPLHTPGGNAAFAYWVALPALLPLFVFGMIGALHLVRSGRTFRWTGWVGSGLLAVAVVAKHWWAWPLPGRYLGAAAAMAFLLAAPRSRIRRGLSWKPLVRVGEASFTLYLIHVPVMRAIETVVPDGLGPAARVGMVGMAVAVAVAGSLVLYRAVERPFHRLARRLAGPT